MMPIVLSSATTAAFTAASSAPTATTANGGGADQLLPIHNPPTASLTAALMATGDTQRSLVADHLRSPDDLSKLHALRKRLEKEHASLDAKLKSGAKDQLEATRDGLLKLQITRKDVSSIQEAFGQVEQLCGSSSGESSAATRSFKVISELSLIHRQFVQTATTLEKFLHLENNVYQLDNMLHQTMDESSGSMPLLLPLHFHLSNLSIFRNETMQVGKSCSSEVRGTLSDVFAPFDDLVRRFEEFFFSLAERTVDIVRDGQNSVIIRMLKIVEKEGREDEQAAAIRLAKKANLEGAARFRSVVANARVIKLYRPKFLAALDKATKELFEECWQRFGAQGDALSFLGHLQWIYEDLEFIRETVAPLFPPDYQIFRFFVKSYHKHLSNILLNNIMAAEPDASSLLTLYQFTQDYRKTMLKSDQVQAEEGWLEPSLLKGKEQGIIDDYLALIIKKIDEWSTNLLSDEVREFVSREAPPEEDSETGQYGMQGAVILFQMVNQQVDAASESGQASVLARVVQHACTAMRQAQSTWSRVLESEFKKRREAKNPDDVPGGLVEYVIALANDQLKSADFADGLGTRLMESVSKKYKGVIREAADGAINGYLDVSKRCTQVLVDLVYLDLKPALKDLFAFPAWYAEGTTAIIVETIRDYLVDYNERLNPALFSLLCDDLIDRFLTTYIGALHRATKLRMPSAGERMRSDIHDVVDLFAPYKSQEELDTQFDVLRMILSMLTASAAMTFLSYYPFAKAHGPNLAFVEHLLKARDDMDKSDVNAVMESCKRKVKQENLGGDLAGGVMQRALAVNATGIFGAIGAWVGGQKDDASGQQGGGPAGGAGGASGSGAIPPVAGGGAGRGGGGGGAGLQIPPPSAGAPHSGMSGDSSAPSTASLAFGAPPSSAGSLGSSGGGGGGMPRTLPRSASRSALPKLSTGVAGVVGGGGGSGPMSAAGPGSGSAGGLGYNGTPTGEKASGWSSYLPSASGWRG
ncbi:SNARE-binding exocyst subunit S6 [Tilletia horrida]|uniref:SNARE-binding exocyst subunit S6 n=1 Tax=Tilletia horrida TaxID=155126 RepID=A0AAN6GKI7_9BASI|nr:SNARE-binding exocyst subunit S6 [Tilletia horrida]KAK0538860.1 SNARE-binding exocyst subunit S6 [Tilletia horrida]